MSVISDLSSMVLVIGQGNPESQEKECHRYRAITSGLCHCTAAPALIHFHMTQAIGAVQHVLGADNLDRLAVETGGQIRKEAETTLATKADETSFFFAFLRLPEEWRFLLGEP